MLIIKSGQTLVTNERTMLAYVKDSDGRIVQMAKMVEVDKIEFKITATLDTPHWWRECGLPSAKLSGGRND